MKAVVRPTTLLLLARARMAAHILLSVIVAMTGLSCGGGDDVLGPVQTVENERLGGIWSGTSASNGSMQSLIGLTTDDGRFRFLSLNTAGQFVGVLTLSDQNQVSAAGFAIAPSGSTWSDGMTKTSFSASGTIATSSAFDLTWGTEAGDTGTINLTYDSINDRGSSMTKVEGTYTGFDIDQNPVGSLTIDSTGAIFGQDVFGCVNAGRISIIDSGFNIYAVTLTLSGCGQFDGGYTGLAFLTDRSATDDELVITVDNGVFYTILLVYL